MKITFDIRADLYRTVQTRAVRENREAQELVADGLRLLLASPGPKTPEVPSLTSLEAESELAKSLLALDAILASRPSPPGRTERLVIEAERLRREGWSAGAASDFPGTDQADDQPHRLTAGTRACDPSSHLPALLAAHQSVDEVRLIEGASAPAAATNSAAPLPPEPVASPASASLKRGRARKET